MSAPCKDCGTRRIGCHGRCEKYAAFRAKNAESKAGHRQRYNAVADKYTIEGKLQRLEFNRRHGRH